MIYYPESIRKKGVVIPNPIAVDNPSTVNSGEENNRVIAAGRLHKQKNFPLLIRAFAAFSKDFPNYSLDIFGEGEEREALQKIVKNLSLTDKVFLKGKTDALFDEFLKSTIYVSSSDYEGISNSMLEAMAAGLPTICTDCPCGGARATIKDGVNGLLVPVGDEDALADALKTRSI